MTAEIASRLAAALADRYTLERQLGQGGMATVYLAHDLKHDRKVAIKVLRPELAAVLGAERFVQEIKTTANLQHPNILPLFDSGEADGFLYYVMPYVEGETLRDKLNRETQLGIEEAVKITTEVADALDYAHGQNVIHRDIKPENILLHAGRPLVADFGIALAVSAAAGGRMTETGLSLGTPHYMSPEQATADKHVTHRSDIYSLGAVLYEMLTGEPPHTGSSAQGIILKIVSEEAVPVTRMRKAVPANVAAAVAKALEKLPADRFESARALAEALTNADYSAAGTKLTAVRTARRTWTVSALAVVAVTMSLLAAWGWPGRPPRVDAPATTRFVEAAQGVSLATAAGRPFDIGPDGSLVIVGTDSTGVSQLFLRRGNVVGFAPVGGTQGAVSPVFSPDGAWVAFTQDDDLKKVPLAGGTPQLVARDARAMELHWGAEDRIAFVESGQGRRGVFVVPASGGRPTLVPGTDTVTPRLVWPHLLPDGLSALVTRFPRLADVELGVLDLESGLVTATAVKGTNAHYLPTGHVVYGHPEGGVFAVGFDLAGHRVRGDPVAVLEDVAVYGGSSMFGGGATQFAVSRTGFTAARGVDAARSALLRVDLAGVAVPMPVDAVRYPGPRYSPDGRYIVFEDGPMGNGRDLYLYDVERDTRTRFTHTGDLSRYATWSRDGAWIYFLGRGEDSRYLDVYRRRADRSGTVEHLAAFEGTEAPQAVLPDGRVLVRANPSTGERPDLEIVTPGDSVPTPFLSNPWSEFAARLSPDGRWVAYTSTETGSNEVYVTSFPIPSSSVKVSEGGGDEAMWSPDGGRLFYWTDDALMAATVTTGTRFEVKGRSQVFRGTFARYPLFPQYDIHPDGKSFVMFGATQGTAGSLVVTVNWFSELRQRMGERR